MDGESHAAALRPQARAQGIGPAGARAPARGVGRQDAGRTARRGRVQRPSRATRSVALRARWRGAPHRGLDAEESRGHRCADCARRSAARCATGGRHARAGVARRATAARSGRADAGHPWRAPRQRQRGGIPRAGHAVDRAAGPARRPCAEPRRHAAGDHAAATGAQASQGWPRRAGHRNAEASARLATQGEGRASRSRRVRGRVARRAGFRPHDRRHIDRPGPGRDAQARPPRRQLAHASAGGPRRPHDQARLCGRRRAGGGLRQEPRRSDRPRRPADRRDDQDRNRLARRLAAECGRQPGWRIPRARQMAEPRRRRQCARRQPRLLRDPGRHARPQHRSGRCAAAAGHARSQRRAGRQRRRPLRRVDARGQRQPPGAHARARRARQPARTQAGAVRQREGRWALERYAEDARRRGQGRASSRARSTGGAGLGRPAVQRRRDLPRRRRPHALSLRQRRRRRKPGRALSHRAVAVRADSADGGAGGAVQRGRRPRRQRRRPPRRERRTRRQRHAALRAGQRRLHRPPEPAAAGLDRPGAGRHAVAAVDACHLARRARPRRQAHRRGHPERRAGFGAGTRRTHRSGPQQSRLRRIADARVGQHPRPPGRELHFVRHRRGAAVARRR